MTPLTDLLNRGWNDLEARNEAIRLLLGELRKRAEALLRRGAPSPVLGPTDLVDRAVEKIYSGKATTWRDRAQFYAYAWRILCNIKTDLLRYHQAKKRQGMRTVELQEGDLLSEGSPSDELEMAELLETMDQALGDVPLLLVRLLRAGYKKQELRGVLRAQHGLKLSRAEINGYLFQVCAWLRSRIEAHHAH